MSNDLYNSEWEPIDDPDKVIKEAIVLLKNDAGAILEPAPIKALQRLYQENPASYNRYRQQVKDTRKVDMSLFDKATRKELKTKNLEIAIPTMDKVFPPVQLWEEPVNGVQLLDEIKATISRYIIADDETLIACTLWVTFTWFTDVVAYAPIANITAPEKRCGKSKLLSVLKKISYKSLSTSNITAPVLFRIIDKYKPTLLIDEVDTFLNQHENMRGIINTGFTKDDTCRFN